MAIYGTAFWLYFSGSSASKRQDHTARDLNGGEVTPRRRLVPALESNAKLDQHLKSSLVSLARLRGYVEKGATVSINSAKPALYASPTGDAKHVVVTDVGSRTLPSPSGSLREKAMPRAAPLATSEGVELPKRSLEVPSAAMRGVDTAALSLERVVASLLKLARLPTKELQHALNYNMDSANAEGGDIFGLQKLRQGQCSVRSASTVPGFDMAIEDWLPPRLPPIAAADFRSRSNAGASMGVKKGGGDGSTAGRSGNEKGRAMVWYEHLSKAGGTSFCKLAMKNMARREVPSYYCMPSEPGNPDARVGQWSNEKLGNYFYQKGHTLVSNEWEPFPLERFAMNGIRMPGGSVTTVKDSTTHFPNLIFVTTLREPLNRLVSAYRFWGVLHNQNPTKPPLTRWLRNMEGRARNDARSPRGIGKGVGTGRDFIAQVGRPNFATWKFSGGRLEVPKEKEKPFPWTESAETEQRWVPAFKTAVRTLAHFDLAIPMEELSNHTEPLGSLLGWSHFESTQFVPSGRIVNNDALAELPTQAYQQLWDDNKLDMVLYNWVRATYLARIHCLEKQ